MKLYHLAYVIDHVRIRSEMRRFNVDLCKTIRKVIDRADMFMEIDKNNLNI